MRLRVEDNLVQGEQVVGREEEVKVLESLGLMQLVSDYFVKARSM